MISSTAFGLAAHRGGIISLNKAVFASSAALPHFADRFSGNAQHDDVRAGGIRNLTSHDIERPGKRAGVQQIHRFAFDGIFSATHKHKVIDQPLGDQSQPK